MERPTASTTDDDLQERLGEVVRRHRSQLGITQEELAFRSGLHRTYIADIERGARNVTVRTVGRLAAALQVPTGTLIIDAAAGAADGSIQRPASPPAEPGEILLVEDSRADASLARRAFTRAKVTNPVRVVPDAETALQFLLGPDPQKGAESRLPQLILLDLNLPGISGLEFLRRIKGDERTRDLPVVVLTVSRHDRVILDCSKLGVEDYIVKPVAIGALASVVPRLGVYLTFGSPPAARHKPATTA